VLRLNKLLALSAADMRLFTEALAVLLKVKLSFVGFHTRRRLDWLNGFAGEPGQPLGESDPVMIRAVAVATRRAARVVPGATCLTQAIAMRTLLERRGQSSSLRIGVARSIGGSLDAHAWVEVNDEIVIGHFAPGSYVPFATNESLDRTIA